MTDQSSGPDETSRRVDLPWYVRLSVPPLTSIASPQETRLELPRGESTYLWLEFPKGCAGLVGVQLWRYSWQLFPRPAGGWYVSDGTTVKLQFREVFADVPLSVTIKAYNLDAIEIHRPWLALEMIAVRSQLAQNLASFLQFFNGT